MRRKHPDEYAPLIKVPIPRKLRLAVIERDKAVCQKCGKLGMVRPRDKGRAYEIPSTPGRKPVCFEIDHVIPKSTGGKTETGNLQLLCRRCNRSKGPR